MSNEEAGWVVFDVTFPEGAFASALHMLEHVREECRAGDFCMECYLLGPESGKVRCMDQRRSQVVQSLIEKRGRMRVGQEMMGEDRRVSGGSVKSKGKGKGQGKGKNVKKFPFEGAEEQARLIVAGVPTSVGERELRAWFEGLDVRRVCFSAKPSFKNTNHVAVFFGSVEDGERALRKGMSNEDGTKMPTGQLDVNVRSSEKASSSSGSSPPPPPPLQEQQQQEKKAGADQEPRPHGGVLLPALELEWEEDVPMSLMVEQLSALGLEHHEPQSEKKAIFFSDEEMSSEKLRRISRGLVDAFVDMSLRLKMVPR